MKGASRWTLGQSRQLRSCDEPLGCSAARHRGERFRSETTHSRCSKGGTGILKIGKALSIGTGTVQRVVMEQPRPFDVDVAEAALASQ